MDGDKILSVSILSSLIKSNSPDPRFLIFSVSLRAYDWNECIWWLEWVAPISRLEKLPISLRLSALSSSKASPMSCSWWAL